jgi:hypothetical protein
VSGVAPNEVAAMLREELATRADEDLGDLPVDAPLFQYGFASLDVIAAVAQVQRALGITTAADIVLDEQVTLASIARRLAAAAA